MGTADELIAAHAFFGKLDPSEMDGNAILDNRQVCIEGLERYIRRLTNTLSVGAEATVQTPSAPAGNGLFEGAATPTPAPAASNFGGGGGVMGFAEFRQVFADVGYENIDAAVAKWSEGAEFDSLSPRQIDDIVRKVRAYAAKQPGGRIANRPRSGASSGGGWRR